MYHKNVECNISQTSHEFEQSFRMSINNEPYNSKFHINLLFSSNFAFIWLLCLRLIAIKSVWHASVSLMSKHLMRLRLNKSNIAFTNFRYLLGEIALAQKSDIRSKVNDILPLHTVNGYI